MPSTTFTTKSEQQAIHTIFQSHSTNTNSNPTPTTTHRNFTVDINLLRRVFHTLDTNHDGMITKIELSIAIHRLQLRWIPVQRIIQYLKQIQQLYPTQEQCITLQQFVAFIFGCFEYEPIRHTSHSANHNTNDTIRHNTRDTMWTCTNEMEEEVEVEPGIICSNTHASRKITATSCQNQNMTGSDTTTNMTNTNEFYIPKDRLEMENEMMSLIPMYVLEQVTRNYSRKKKEDHIEQQKMMVQTITRELITNCVDTYTNHLDTTGLERAVPTMPSTSQLLHPTTTIDTTTSLKEYMSTGINTSFTNVPIPSTSTTDCGVNTSQTIEANRTTPTLTSLPTTSQNPVTSMAHKATDMTDRILQTTDQWTQIEPPNTSTRIQNSNTNMQLETLLEQSNRILMANNDFNVYELHDCTGSTYNTSTNRYEVLHNIPHTTSATTKWFTIKKPLELFPISTSTSDMSMKYKMDNSVNSSLNDSISSIQSSSMQSVGSDGEILKSSTFSDGEVDDASRYIIYQLSKQLYTTSTNYNPEDDDSDHSSLTSMSIDPGQILTMPTTRSSISSDSNDSNNVPDDGQSSTGSLDPGQL